MKAVSDTVLRRISEAIDAMASDTSMARTKRALEVQSGLSHDAVARAFRLDLSDPTPYRLNEKFEGLRSDVGGRRSPDDKELQRLRAELREASRQIKALEVALSAQAQVLLAQSLELAALKEPTATVVVPMRRRRPRN